MKNQRKNISILKVTLLSFFLLVFLTINSLALNIFEQNFSDSNNSGIIYRNPRVYNVGYSFEMFPEPNKIDRSKDLKVWIPIPREWNSQKAVKIISVEPAPHARYIDPEHGNPILFWDFGREPEKSLYKVDIKYRLESYEVHAEVDPENIEPYDKTSKEYALYTRSTHTISVTPKIKELAQIAIEDQKNPYRQAQLIYNFVREKVRRGGEICGFRRIRGIGVKTLLEFPVIDRKTGEEYYEGMCYESSKFFIALCRAVGIPARAVFVFYPDPQLSKKDPEPFDLIQKSLSSEGLSADEIYGIFAHVRPEFYIPGYGWIPVDPHEGVFAFSKNDVVIDGKGTDIQIGPNAPQEENRGYGIMWIGLNNGRADCLWPDVRNIAKIRKAEVKISYHPDPFPADAFAGYSAEKEGADQALILIDDITRGKPDKEAALEKAYKENPQLWYQLESYICHMLRKMIGDEKFFEIYDTYIDLRIKSGEPVSTARFNQIAEEIYGQPLDWFFNQWTKYTVLPQLKLDAVTLSKNEEGWRITGNLYQLNSKLFRLPVELVFETEGSTERKRIWMESKNSSFEFVTSNRPKRVLVDPDKDTLQIREMPPHLADFWSAYPDLLIVYGTIAEEEVNKAAVESFMSKYPTLDASIVKADVDVNDADLKKKCLILFGRPDTNKIARRFEDLLPIKFDSDKITWQGKTYDKPSHGAAQIVEDPNDSTVLIIQFAALGPEAMHNLDSKYLSFKTSYVIFDGDKTLFLDNWQHGNELIWDFEEN